jgi:hypothetical protein
MSRSWRFTAAVERSRPRPVPRAGTLLAFLCLIAAASCARLPPTAAVAIPPIPAGAARVWVYRDYEPYAGRGRPAVYLNSGMIGVAELGGAFFRDVPPGRYVASVETYGIDTNQVSGFDLAPGEEAFVKIVSLPSWVEEGDVRSFERPTFYAWLTPADRARPDIAQLSFYGGG